MVKQKEVLVLIPARGGSKGIPRKNIRDFAGSPLISYSIAAGLQAETVTRVIVSTDDEEIAAVARQCGAETPFLRPAEFAQDRTLDLPVFEHALAWLKKNENYVPDAVVQLRPTSPVRPKSCVDEAVQTLFDHPDADSVRGVVPAGQNPHKMWRIHEKSGRMQNLLDVSGVDEPYNAPRQALPPVYWQTGHIDTIRTETILEKHSMSGSVILPLMIEPRFTVDLDNLWDWEKAEWLVLHGNLDMVVPERKKKRFPDKVEMVVFDFDGTLTDDRVWVNEDGLEYVAANRGDGMGIAILQKNGVKTVVISSEENKVVSARCKKLNLTVVQGVGVGNKAAVLTKMLKEEGIDPVSVIYVGNDINDIPCFPLVGCAVVVADAHPEALKKADYILSRKGGHGAVREICDLVVKKYFK